MIVAGIGLFFVGINLLSHNMKQLSMGYVRRCIAVSLDRGAVAFFAGLLAGAVANSAKAIAFVTAGFVAAGFVTAYEVLPVMMGASIGSSLIVFWSAINIKVAVLFLLGIVGVGFQYELSHDSNYRKILGALLGIGLVFYGLQLLKEGAGELQDVAWFRDLILQTSHYRFAALGIGAVLALIAQSGSAIAIIAVSLASVGLIDIDQTIMLIIGTNLGSGCCVWLMSTGLKGSSRRIVIFYAMLKGTGAMVLIPALYLETYCQIPLLKWAVGQLTVHLGFQVAIIYLAYECVSALAVVFFLQPIYRGLERLLPDSGNEDRYRLKYIAEQLQDAEVGTDLVLKEIREVCGRIPDSLMAVSDDRPPTLTYGFRELHTANLTVLREIRQYLNDLMKLEMQPATAARLLSIQNLLATLTALEENAFSLAELIDRREYSDKLRPLAQNIIEGLNTNIIAVHEVMAAQDKELLSLLLSTANDSGATVERFRQQCLGDGDAYGMQDKTVMLAIIDVYARLCWLVNNVARDLNAGDFWCVSKTMTDRQQA